MNIKEVIKILEKILGYCGKWDENDIISVQKKTGHCVSMKIKTFIGLLKMESKLLKEGRIKKTLKK